MINPSKHFDAKNGFTLIEVMIVITIMSTLSILTYSSIQQSLTSKQKITQQIDDLSQIRDTLRIMERDINLAFHFRDTEKAIYIALDKAKNQSNPNAAPTPDPNDPPPSIYDETPVVAQENLSPALKKKFQYRIDPTTHFVGEEQKMSFVTMNQANIMKNVPVSDFMEVGYELKSCRSLSDNTKTSNCLWRRTHSLVDDDPTLGGNEVVLLENITEFKIRYTGKGKQDWVSQWSSKNNSDSVTSGAFPQSIEISLTTEVGIPKTNKKKKIATQIVAQVHFPNNPEKKQ